MGASRGILVTADNGLEPINIAKCLKAIIEKENPDLVILGKQAIDDDSNQTGQMLAALLNWSQGTFASKLEFQGGGIIVTREIDGGLETLELQMPTIITTDLRLNEPRYASLPNIMKAKKKPIDQTSPDDLGIKLRQHVELVSVSSPEKRLAGTIVNDVPELVEKLRSEAKVI